MIQDLVKHVWQSTLFAGAAGVLACLLRGNRAAVRHGVWMAASLKFLVPFSLLVALGSHAAWRVVPPSPEAKLNSALLIAGPIASPVSKAVASPREAPDRTPAFLFAVWLCGFAANSLLWHLRWRRIRAVARAASPEPMHLPIPALLTSSALEPGVFGILRPRLLLPAGLRERLTAAQFDSIVAHELCHVRRRDNLWSAVHMLVEALFWFDPAVWWIGSRLMNERERACDEAVLQSGGEPEDYARGIVTVCHFWLQSPLPCVPGVTGADLKRRLAAILENRTVPELSAARKLLLAAAATGAVAAPLIVGLVEAPSIRAQEPSKPVPQLVATSSLPAFEVASIKPAAPDSSLKVDFAPGGKLFITNASLRFLIKIAYDIGDDQLTGGPGWVASRRFDLAATPDHAVSGDPTDMAPDQILAFHKPTRLRLQRLLADRFQLELKRESAAMPVYALVVAPGGTKNLSPAKNTGDAQMNMNAGSGILNARAVDMNSLAHFLSEGQTGRPVIDLSSLPGKFDFRLEWTPDPGLNPLVDATANAPSDAGGISIFTALQQQLGLKLEARTAPADRLVIARAELPSSN